MIPLRCCVKKYEWGKRGMDSCIARYLRNQMPSYTVDDDTPFAEVKKIFCLLHFDHLKIDFCD